jgi:threonine/homoserine/homoserine lactone efflux protein
MFELLSSHPLLPDLPRLLTFVMAAFALNITPGADMTFVATSAARGGARSGISAALGAGVGSLVHLTAAVVGLSALIASSQAAFTILKWVGAAYLIYVAFTLLRGAAPRDEAAPLPRSNAELFRSGVLVNVSNPKVGLFFLAFLPQFVDPIPGVAGVQTFLLGLWVNGCGTLVNVVVAIITARAAAGLRGVSWVGQAARWISATIMGALAVKLVTSDRR